MTSNTHRQFVHTYRWGIILGLSLLSGWLLWPTGPSRHFSPPGVVECVSAEGRRAGTRDGQIIDLIDGRVLVALPAQTALCAISPNGAWFARFTFDQSNRAGTIARMRLDIMAIDQPGHIYHLLIPDVPTDITWEQVALSNNGEQVAINRAFLRNDVRILATQTGMVIASVPTGRELERVYAMQFTADDRLLMLRFPRKVQAMDTTTWQVAATWEQAEGTVALAPNARFFITCSPTGLLVYDLEQLRAAPRELPSCPFRSVPTISPDGRYLLVAENRSGGPFWTFFSKDEPNLGPAVRMALVRLSDGAVVQHFRGSRGYVSWPAFQPDGAELVTYGPGGDFHAWPVRPRPVWLQWLGWVLLAGALLLLVERRVARLRRQPNRRAR